MKNLVSCICLGFLFSLHLCCAQRVVTAAQFEPIQREILQLIEEEKIPSMAVAVAKDGKVIWQEAFGWADKEGKIKATPQTIYPLGSLSKSIAATGMMTLIENGRVTLDDTVNDLIKPAKLHSFHGSADAVKVLHILNMSAGIPHGWTSYPDRIFDPLTEEEKNQFVEKIGLVTFPPGEVQQYSNYSYGFLDLMMERVSGQPLEEYMQESVFRPLQMTNSYTRYQAKKANRFAIPYSNNSPMDPFHFLPYGGGGYFSTAEDLIHYGMFYLRNQVAGQKQILSNETIDFMHHFDEGPAGLFRIGWFDMGHAVASNGNITGANAMIMLIPGENVAIVCLTNTHLDSYADQIADKIMDHLLPDLQRQMTYEKYIPIYEPPYQSNDRLLGQWEGKIHIPKEDIPILMTFKQDGIIEVQLENGEIKTLRNATFNQFDKLEGSIDAHIPVPEKRDTKEVTCNLTLVYQQDRLYGHICPRFGYEDGTAFSYGRFVSLERKSP